MLVETLRRYPVKSMLGEEVAESRVTERGLDGDRVRAVLDVATGKIASAKNPRLWRGLLTVEGSRVPGDAELSELLGREVRLIDVPPEGAELERSVPEQVLAEGIEAEVPHTITTIGRGSPAGTFFDFAPIHLITTSTVERIGELSPRGHVEAVRYRPNVVIATEAAGFVENDWVGRELHLGEDVVLHVIVASPRCAIPTLAHGALERDTEALRTVSRHNRVPVFDLEPQACAGVYARVLRPGVVRKGDLVRLA
ncbi:MOSC domain-containing protein [Nonomuraea gerenzanensis]|uniref:Flavodoxin reductases (Ferredoxin-NADPH reductases) family 1 n=1 Tax=Nonomuraea gerenzanensis TaxID=93944 RepID=A0A1M4E2F7_9ACTN|nr:MOSC domain-containing protein [Nonomuraea gerenzanensis]UBU15249.1 MOSC domain-containing protein [Nonomuraea gerenzanensis]SBO92992.1 Flavodoxin reductases (ferredoxin-NADPH reductases) family 1 [Nonomuraea gerenzanensis]